jgi:eukaryotic-like serine/threonine-protein kinase
VNTITKAGRYELREELGRGAMGVVYHAHDPVIGREVAVKTIHLSSEGTGMSREELVGRFQTEAHAAGLLTHPNIVVIYDAGEEEGLFYITMEMVRGRSLQAMLDGRQLFPLPRVMKLMEQVCSALDFAHQHNVVHRDIKPANLVLTADDAVKITDFGTAKILQFGTSQTAHVMGTPSYMSPEQVKGKPVDGRSDIFSLGVILYELMTGEKPFPGQNITTVIYKIINEEPISPRSLDSSIHPGLSAVITRALAKDPNARFQTCHELLDALKNYREQVSPGKIVRIPPADSQPAAGEARPSAPQARPPAVQLQTHPRKVEPPHQLISAAAFQAEEASRRRVSLVLSLIFLGIIGFAGYRIWPAMKDLWQRAHEPVERQLVQPKSAPVAPAVNSGLPDTKSGAKPVTSPQVAPPEQEPAPRIAESSKTQQASHPAVSLQTPPQVTQQVAAPAPPAKLLTSEPPPGVGSAAKSAAPQKPDTSSSTPAANAVETRLRNELARLSLADKVKVQVTANALTLSGRVTPKEHLMLVNRLHWVPAKVRVVDDLEYTSGLEVAPATASLGWVWVRSEPPGAEIVVDGADSRLRSPARVEMPQGEHEVRLVLRGFPVSERTVLVQPGQTILFTQPLAQQ